MRAFKLGGTATKLVSVVAVAVGLSIGLGGTAGAATDANYAFARTQGIFGLSFGFPDIPLQISWGKSAVNVSFRVNGQAYGHGAFTVADEQGPYLNDPSAANASSAYCQGCLTNAIAINVNVISGPANAVYVPTKAVATNDYCVGCNTLAADYTFVVAPGMVASLTPAGLSDLYAIAQQVVAEAKINQPSQILAGDVVSALGEIQAVLDSPVDLDPVGPAQPAAVPLQPQAQVQQFGETQYSTTETG